MSDDASEEARPGRLIRETVILLVVAIGLAVLVKTLFVQAFYIPSGSMEPGLQVNDRILVEKPSYWFGGDPQRGDIVVFDDPGDWLTAADDAGPTTALAKAMSKIGLYPSGGHLVKRVVGVEGDMIVCCDAQGRIEVNGKALDEDGFIRPQPNPPNSCDGPMVTFSNCKWTAGPVPEGRLFVMGDNRNNSADSSFHLCRKQQKSCDPMAAFVPVDLVVGKVFALVWPVKHFDWLGRPDAFHDIPDGE